MIMSACQASSTSGQQKAAPNGAAFSLLLPVSVAVSGSHADAWLIAVAGRGRCRASIRATASTVGTGDRGPPGTAFRLGASRRAHFDWALARARTWSRARPPMGLASRRPAAELRGVDIFFHCQSHPVFRVLLYVRVRVEHTHSGDSIGRQQVALGRGWARGRCRSVMHSVVFVSSTR
jgi:hypothetical protein